MSKRRVGACVAELLAWGCGGTEAPADDPGPVDLGSDRSPVLIDFGLPLDPGTPDEDAPGDAPDEETPPATDDGGGDADVPAVPDAGGDVVDAFVTADEGTPDAADPGEAVPDVAPDAPEANDVSAEVHRDCVEDEDCAGEVTGLEACERAVCDPETWTCKAGPALPGAICEDGNPCTQGDECSATGLCLAGINGCDCDEDADCDPFDDDDLCNGVLGCTVGKCVLVRGIVTCPPSPGSCSEYVCLPADGFCREVARNEGLACDDKDPCTLNEKCVAKSCRNGVPMVCDDLDPCTQDVCQRDTGCRADPITGPWCDDGDVCTVGDACAAGECVPGAPRDCDDHDPCTTDRCEAGGCVHDPAGGAAEGPADDATCAGGQDEDCDGATDADDPDCRFRVTSFDPAEAPAGVPVPVEIHGDGLEDVVEVLFGPDAATITARENGRLVALAPVHVPGQVTVRVRKARIGLDAGTFTYTGIASPLDWGTIQSPLSLDPVVEGGSTPAIYGQVYEPDVTGPGRDPAVVRAQLCRGPRGTLPWVAQGWTCTTAAHNPGHLGNPSNFEYKVVIAPPAGSWDLFYRFSLDGVQWLYVDRDGNDVGQGGTNGCTSDQALALDVTAL